MPGNRYGLRGGAYSAKNTRAPAEVSSSFQLEVDSFSSIAPRSEETRTFARLPQLPYTGPMKNVAVIGATGIQGSGVVSALLSDPTLSVTVITSNPTSARAKALAAKHSDTEREGRFNLVVGNLNDKSSLEKALESCQLLFAAFGPGPTPRDGEVAEELQQGRNLVDAAKVRFGLHSTSLDTRLS